MLKIGYLLNNISINLGAHLLTNISLHIVRIHEHIHQHFLIKLVLHQLGPRIRGNPLDIILRFGQQPAEQATFQWIHPDHITDRADYLEDRATRFYPPWDTLQEGLLDLLAVGVGGAH